MAVRMMKMMRQQESDKRFRVAGWRWCGDLATWQQSCYVKFPEFGDHFFTGPADRPFFVLTFCNILPKEKWLLQTTFAEIS
jgi:hypothetical protein